MESQRISRSRAAMSELLDDETQEAGSREGVGRYLEDNTMAFILMYIWGE